MRQSEFVLYCIFLSNLSWLIRFWKHQKNRHIDIAFFSFIKTICINFDTYF